MRKIIIAFTIIALLAGTVWATLTKNEKAELKNLRTAKIAFSQNYCIPKGLDTIKVYSNTKCDEEWQATTQGKRLTELEKKANSEKDIDKALKNVAGLQTSDETKLDGRREPTVGFNDGYAEGGSGGTGDMLGGLMGGSGGSIGTKAYGYISGGDYYSDYRGSAYRGNGDKYESSEENPFVNTKDNAVSTFSIDADGGSYGVMRRYLNLGRMPPKKSVRIEEYINYFTFDYSEPTGGENIALNSELSTNPWAPEHYLLRLGIKGKTIPEKEMPNSNFVLLIDVSGSMDSDDKLGLLKNGFKQMIDEMRPTDRVAIVTYAGKVQVLLNSTYCEKKDKIKNAIDKLRASGSTAGGAGIQKAYEIAKENFIPNGNNRIILGTDGDFNVGISNKDELVEFIKQKRKSGVYLTALGVGMGNLNDAMMERVANNGNGNYEYIDNAKQIKKVFVYEKSKFYTVAKDSKIQITFNPEKVKSYRLIGYENRKLNKEDFEDDTVDAGEIGSGQTITAIYELVLNDTKSSASLGNFDFRYIKPNETQSRLLNHKIGSGISKIWQSSENMRFAAAVACLGLQAKNSEYKGRCSKSMVLDLGNSATSFDPNGFRAEFLDLVKNAEVKNVDFDLVENAEVKNVERPRGSIKTPSARDIDVDTDSPRSKAEIMAVTNARMPGLRNIYNKYLKLKPGFSGKVTLKFTIAPSGDIINISVVSSTTGYGDFDYAVMNMVRTWKWKAIKSGNATATIPFNFTES